MILGICGSPRSAATEFVLKNALIILEEKGLDTTYFSIRGKKISPCIHCDYCITNNECVLKDDMYILYDLLRTSKAIVIATPVYNAGVSAQLKAVIDRTRALFASDPKVLRGNPGIAIAVGGDRAGGQELAIQQIHTFYILNGMIPISGGFFGANLGAVFWSKDSLQGVKDDCEGFRSLRKTVNKLFEYLLGKV